MTKIHFIWFTGPKSRGFGFVNYLAVRAASVQNAEIVVHHNTEPENNPHWEAIRPFVTLSPMVAPTTHNGVALDCPQYQSDVARLQILAEHGGIYLDCDTLLLKPLDPAFFDHDCVMSPDRTDDATAMNAGLIMAAPGSAFIAEWLEAMRPSETWAEHSTALPWRIYQADSTRVHLRPASEFMPCPYGEDYVDDAHLDRLGGAYAVHLWESYWEGHRPPITADYFADHDNAFTRAFRKYLPRRLKICVYAISLNEAKFTKRFCDSAADADLILIADTGSTDDTVSLARECGAVVHHIHINPWRFDLARNAAMALIPGDMDVCVSLDLDEELQPGWREEIERVWKPGTNRLSYGFDWGAGIIFQYTKIHARGGFLWFSPCHEYPIPDRRTVEVYAQTDMLMVIHKPDPEKSRGQYMDLLQVAVDENPRDPRTFFYYARELSFCRRWQEAIDACTRYLAMPEATWENERCYAMRVASRCAAELGRYSEAFSWARKAVAEAPETREPWMEVATLAYRTSRWAECYGAAMSALQIKDRQLVYTCDPAVWGAAPHDLASIAAWHLGLPREAAEQAKLAVEKEPNDDRLKANLAFLEAVE